MNRKARRAAGGTTPPPDQGFAAAQSAHAAGDLARAEQLYRALLARQPGHGEAWHHLGLIRFQQGDLAGAVPLLEKAITVQAAFPAALTHLGMVLEGLGQPSQALARAREALRQAPSYAPAQALAAGLLCDKGQSGEGLPLFAQAILALGNDPAMRRNYALALAAAGQSDAARQQFQHALALAPGWALAISELAGLEAAAGSRDTAAELYRRAVALAPTDPTILGNAGKFLFDGGDLTGAKTLLDQGLASAPGHAQLRLTRAALRLALGEIDGGWQDYAYRHSAGAGQGPRPLRARTWGGEPLEDDRLLIWREQGVGDELLFATIYPDVLARARHVTIECDPRLVPLFTRSFPGATIAPDSQTAPEPPQCAVEAACGSLPGLFRRQLADFPRGGPVFVPDPLKTARWRVWLDSLGAGLKIGLCWRGRLQTADRASAYTSLPAWRDLLSLPDVTIISLQYGDPEPELAAFTAAGGRAPLVPPGLDLLNDFDGCAALYAALDLVIAPGTAAAPLAAGIGVPVHWLTLTNDWNFLGAPAWPWHTNVQGHRKQPFEPWDSIVAGITLDVQRRAKG